MKQRAQDPAGYPNTARTKPNGPPVATRDPKPGGPAVTPHQPDYHSRDAKPLKKRRK
jgi:hypothetical protein